MSRLTRARWPLVVLPAILVGTFEYWRHTLFNGFPEFWGNIAAAVMAGVGSYVYYRYTLTVVERLTTSLHEEEARQALMDQRDRIAGQLHDSLAQTLFFLNAELDRANSHLARGEVEKAAHSVAEAKNGVAFAHQDLRETIAALQRCEWDKPLVPSLRNMATAFYRQSGIQVDVSLPQSVPDLPPAAREAIFRLSQEALTNVRKHSKAKRARLALDSIDGGLKLTIVDDGVGFRPEAVGSGYGIPEMKRLAHSLQGRVEIESSDSGTRIELKVPVANGLQRTKELRA